MATSGDREITLYHLDRNLAGRLKEENIWRERHVLGSRRSWDGKLESWNDGTDTGDALVVK